MKNQINHWLASSFGTVVLYTALAPAAMAQHDHHKHGSVPAASQPSASNYAGLQHREIKALSPQERVDWLDGKGMGLAKAAELNGYPGPMHTLEHAEILQLSDMQREQTQQLLDRHKARVRELGQKLVEAERQLDRAFSSRQASAVEIRVLAAETARLQGLIRAEHLVTHLEQTELLSAAQIKRYNVVRGYSN